MTEKVILKNYQSKREIRTRNIWIEFLWRMISFLTMENPICFCGFFKVLILRVFGAKIGQNVVIKPCVKIKYPWKLTIGSHTWLGEDVWIDNIDDVVIGENVCLSQGVYLCTGNHDWSRVDFALMVKNIIIEEGVWIGAKSLIAPGVHLASHSVITLGSVVLSSTQPYQIYQGNPAIAIKQRKIHQ